MGSVRGSLIPISVVLILILLVVMFILDKRKYDKEMEDYASSEMSRQFEDADVL